MTRSIRSLVSMAAIAMVLASCGGLLDVTDPTLVRDVDINNASGANARRVGVISLLNQGIGEVMRNVAFFSDERMQDHLNPWPYAGDFPLSWYLDMRDGDRYESFQDERHLSSLFNIMAHGDIAAEAVRSYSPDSLRGDFLTQLYAIRAYAVAQIAEDVCPGFPINQVRNNQVVYGGPYTTDAALEYAVALLDSALDFDADSARIVNFARVIRGRALLDLGRWSEAASAVADVPTSFSYVTDGGYNGGLYVQPWAQSATSAEVVGDREGGNGLPFASARDPRVPTVFLRTVSGHPADSLYDQVKYPAADSRIVLASGIEARLVEAEAALASSDPAWLTILNDLRATEIDPGMEPLDDPGTSDARIDLLYRERAFWLYLTGRRLGDLRRLIRQYGRNPETVMPSGAYASGGIYGSATAIPFIFTVHAETNPNIVSGCTVR